MTYTSKFGILPFVIILLFASIILTVSIFKEETIGMIVGGGLIIVYLLLYFLIHYIVKENAILVKLGTLTLRKIPIEKVTRIEKTNNMLSAPAFSINRIYIFYKDENDAEQFSLISPARQKKFIEELKAINSNIALG